MKHKPAPLRRAACLLLAAAALPFTPLAAQDTQAAPPPAQPPVVDVPAPAIVPAPTAAPAVPAARPAPAVSAPPLATSNAPAPVPARRAAPARAARRAPAPARASTAARPARAPAESIPPVQAPPEASAPTAAPAPQASTDAAAPSFPIASTPPTATPAPARQARGESILLGLLAAIIALGALTFLLRRRRRVSGDRIEEVPVAAPLAGEEPAIVAAATPTGRPWLELLMRPVRAGIEDKDAVVEFELTVDNQGPLPARDVRISTWMAAAGAETEMEHALIDRSGEQALPPVTIDPGNAKKIERSVSLPTGDLETDSVLPVVSAEARYRLPDGSEGRTAASFEIGVRVGDALAHFDVEHPSGLHDDVEARLHGEPERV